MFNKYNYIMKMCLASDTVNVYELFRLLVSDEKVPMHGPKHHMIDGACILTAYYNAGGDINLKDSLNVLAKRAKDMPGAMCGFWGVCGAVTSVGAALSIIDGTGPLSSENTDAVGNAIDNGIDDWGKHMELTSAIIKRMSDVGGPRCCKRNGLIALKMATGFINENYEVNIEWTDAPCTYCGQNEQCIRGKCTFWGTNI